MKQQILIAVFIMFIIFSTVVDRSSSLDYLSFVSSEDSQMKQEINNSLNYMMKNSQDYLSDPMLVSLWVMSKSFLGRYDNRTEVIDYFNSRQESDGAWSGAGGRMFTTHRVLLAYYLLNATPAQNLDTFFSNYDTWSEAENYMLAGGSGDGRNMYHVIVAWVSYYWNYPPWMDDFFNQVETDLSWTSGSDFHKRTHILYSYVIARRPFPNLDGIIDATLDEQMSDGHWELPSLGNRPVYLTSIQITLLSQILKLYPNYRTNEINTALEKARLWTESVYHTSILDGSTCGYFGDLMTIEDSVFCGLLCAGQTGLVTANIDMTFQDLYSKIIRPSPSPSSTPSPTPTPTPTPTPIPTPTPTPSPSSSQQPIPTQKPQPTPSPPAEIIYSLAAATGTAVIVTVTLLLRRRRRALAVPKIG
jgi:hypothetical protein